MEQLRAMVILVAFLGCLFVVAASLKVGSSYGRYSADGEKLIDECEAKLPRDQHCKIIAVPINSIGKKGEENER